MQDDALRKLMERALPCRCKLSTHPGDGLALLTLTHCPRHNHGPAVLEALREAENKGAREMRDKCAKIVKRAADDAQPMAADYLDDCKLSIRRQPLPHPDAENSDA